MKMNLKPAFRYKFRNFLKGSAIVYFVMILVVLVCMVTAANSSSTSFNIGYSMAVAIFMFVMGVANFRSDLRLGVQFGVSRRTSFVSELLAVLSTSVLLGIVGELLIGIAQIISAGNSNFIIAELYQIIYHGTDKVILNFYQHTLSALLNASLVFTLCLLGMFFTLLFWRLNKVFTIIVAVCIPLSINIIPFLLYRAGVNFEPFLNWIQASPFNFILSFMLLAILLIVIDWLLLRRANIKAESKK